ncbi:glycosyl hydrolase family 18 protein [Anaeromicropila herbilytica]|uniref:Germination protein n=1 Tax=Anaeromicropila herbilytica TaxID=2785025 RepID=A0A7R7EJ49_9FIRM|nr:glycosyl hydrolase family 18 protein [Anaeromicropila herbilytica]BCN29715.1 germination protein [Anaeromicropila herbilytica]
MTIHVVKKGDTIQSIASQYKVSPTRLAQDNMLDPNQPLVEGQTVVILFPEQIHIVKEGDTLVSIAKQYNVSVINLIQNNSWLTMETKLAPGQEVVISFKGEKLGNIALNGYAYPFIKSEIYLDTLPYLTYTTLFTYGFTKDGTLIPIDDQQLINTARNFGVAPLMLISTLTSEGVFSNELAHAILNDMTAQNNLINNVLENMKKKNYYGLDIDFEYILPEDRLAYVDFIKNITTKLNPQGYEVMVALAPKTSATQPGLLYESHDYKRIGEVANKVLLMTYEWGFTFGPPMAVAPINKVREVLDYAVTEIDPAKIFLGVPNYGYDFKLPFVKGTSQAKSLGNVEAVNLAREVGAAIQYDETSQAPFFKYKDSDGSDHEVWFEDARSIEAKLRLVPEYNFQGASYWTIMKFFPQSWLVAISLFNIDKLI